MIDKGTYPPVTADGQPQLSPFKWDVFCLLAGLILVLGGVGVSLFMMGQKGVAYWYTGIIPLVLGAALLLFYRLYYKK